MFLIDAQLPPGLAKMADGQGCPSGHVNDPGPGAATDDQIEAAARETQAVIRSKDADFAVLARRPSGRQVVRLRLGNGANGSLRDSLTQLLPAARADLENGERLIEIR